MVMTLTAGAIFVMWLGEQITERGIGNGQSLLITFSILERLWPVDDRSSPSFVQGRRGGARSACSSTSPSRWPSSRPWWP